MNAQKFNHKVNLLTLPICFVALKANIKTVTEPRKKRRSENYWLYLNLHSN